jgi:hypothetical protein
MRASADMWLASRNTFGLHAEHSIPELVFLGIYPKISTFKRFLEKINWAFDVP